MASASTGAAAGSHSLIRQRLVAPDAAPFGEFGSTVSVSGSEAIVGTLFSGGNGRAYIFARRHGRWTFKQELEPSNPNAFDFGSAVSICGSTALVGDSGAGAGQVAVYRRSHGVWSQTQTLSEQRPAAGDLFGFSLGLSGNLAVIGAPNRAVGVFDEAGAVDVYARSGTTWSFRQELAASDPSFGGDVGWSVALDRSTVVAGAPFDHASGTAYVFANAGSTWRQTAELAPADGTPDFFGWSVAASGSRMVIGSPGLMPTPSRAFVYGRSAGGWGLEATLHPSVPDPSDDFGLDVDIRGNTIAVGDPDRQRSSGLVNVYRRVGGAWLLARSLLPPAGAVRPQFGESVGLGRGELFAGAPGTANLRGAVDVVRLH